MSLHCKIINLCHKTTQRSQHILSNNSIKLGVASNSYRSSILSPSSRSNLYSLSTSSKRPSIAFFSTVSPSSTSDAEVDSHSDFRPQVKVSDGAAEANEIIQKDISSNPVFLYMKGTPDSPRCGFSANVVRILGHLNTDFQSRDVLTSNEIREGVKKFSDWPTIPQLYVKGEFVGGSDIVTSMFKNGELEKVLKEAGAIREPNPTAAASA